MVVVKIELWPGGREANKRNLGRIEIRNSGVGTETTGQYLVRLFKNRNQSAKSDGVWKEGEVKDFPRKRLGGYDLVYRALRNILKDRNPD